MRNCLFESIWLLNSTFFHAQIPFYFKNIHMNNVFSLNEYLIKLEDSVGGIDSLTVFNCSNAIISLVNSKIIMKNSIFNKTIFDPLDVFLKESCIKFQDYTIEMESYFENVIFDRLLSNNNGSVNFFMSILYLIFHRL